MKRYFLPICFIAALSLFSCNNTTEEPENGGTAGRAKLVFDIVYPDGETDVI